MTVTCRMTNCPFYEDGFCCNETILITNDGKCFDLIKGFTQEQFEQVKKIITPSKIEDIEINEINKSENELKEDFNIEQNDNVEVNDGQSNEDQKE